MARWHDEGSSSSSVCDDTGTDALSHLALVANLALQDVDRVTASRKGKLSACAPRSDEEIAFDLYAEEAHALLAFSKDVAFAQSLDNALRTDQAYLQEVIHADEVARSDRELALALEQGRTPVAAEPALAAQRPPVSAASATASSSSTQIPWLKPIPELKKEMCVFCREDIDGADIRAPCGHHWDTSCLIDLFRAATTDETLFPPRCCKQPFVLREVQHYLGAQLLAAFVRVSVEFSTADRVYCHRPTCSAFIGAATEHAETMACPTCPARTCGCCKKQAHTGGECSSADDAPVLALAEQEGWKRCPGCRHLVELTQGCYHMTCRCGKQFCYVCRETWKRCDCPQWDEQRLYATAENRVRRELPAAGPPPAAPRLQEMVRQAAEELRVNHDCQHRWLYRRGGGQCENCSHYLGLFLFNCRWCHMNVCARCRRNRL